MAAESINAAAVDNFIVFFVIGFEGTMGLKRVMDEHERY